MLRIVSNAPINILLDHSVTIICQYCIDYKKDIFIQAETWVVKECMHEPMTQQTFLLVKTYWRRLEDVFSVIVFCLPRRLQDVLNTSSRHDCKTSYKHVLKTSRRRFAKTYCKNILNPSWKTKNCFAEDVFMTSWRRLGWQEMFTG